MNKLINVVIIAFLLLSFSLTPIFAINNSPIPDASLPSRDFVQARTDRKIELGERIEAHKAQMAEKKAQIRDRTNDRIASHEASLSEARKSRATEHFGRLYTRFSAAITRLDTLVARIEARLEVYKEERPDTDTSAIESDLAEAKSLLLDAKVDLDAVNGSFDDILDSDDPKATFEIIKESISDIKDNLKGVHRILVSVIGDIKGLRVGNTNQSSQ